ncbi:MAG: ornithine carbamoyltransferase, partial [Clostridiales bacterium]|nr:ornithine carbamoyltransferase [Clostridiales bacterium]
LLELSHKLKDKKKAGKGKRKLKGKNIVLLFDKASTRTRCAFEVAAYDLGASVTYLDKAGSQMGKKESLEDTANVLGRFYDAIEYRGYEQEVVELLARHSGVPVYNGLTDVDHPTQILADLMTMEECLLKPVDKCKVVFVGDTRNNMSLAWMIAASKLGFDYVGLGPKALHPDKDLVSKLDELAKLEGGSITFEESSDNVSGADVIYTDVWASMGEEDQLEQRVKLLSPYRVDLSLVEKIGGAAYIFMHCLPAFHDFETTNAKAAQKRGLDIREVTDEVFRSSHSVVFEQAENRMHTIKAVLAATLS